MQCARNPGFKRDWHASDSCERATPTFQNPRRWRPNAGFSSKFSWEDQGKVSPVKNQNPKQVRVGRLADLGHVETQVLLRDGLEVDLAEQDLIDCGRKGAIARMECGISYETENPYKKKDAPTDPTPGVLEQPNAVLRRRARHSWKRLIPPSFRPTPSRRPRSRARSWSTAACW